MKLVKLLVFFLLISHIQCRDINEIAITSEVINQYTFNNAGRGCGNFIVYSFANDSISMTIRGDRDTLGLNDGSKTFILPNKDLKISLNQFDGPAGSFYCDDVSGNEGSIINSYSVVSGEATIRILKDDISQNPTNRFFTLRLELVNVIFKLEDDNTEFYERLIFNDVAVGWIPG